VPLRLIITKDQIRHLLLFDSRFLESLWTGEHVGASQTSFTVAICILAGLTLRPVLVLYKGSETAASQISNVTHHCNG
jgi:hypothetical protein